VLVAYIACVEEHTRSHALFGATEMVSSVVVTKTKDFNRETEVLTWIGGGENRTLVLSKRLDNDYMLIVFNKISLDEDATQQAVCLLYLELLTKRQERLKSSYRGL